MDRQLSDGHQIEITFANRNVTDGGLSTSRFRKAAGQAGLKMGGKTLYRKSLMTTMMMMMMMMTNNSKTKSNLRTFTNKTNF